MKKHKKAAIVQSNYIPWKGYFDLINMVDEFILFDDMQYTRRDWRNRNKIKTVQGIKWLTIPVKVKGNYFQRINQTTISDPHWTKSHWKTLCQNYTHSPYFPMYKSLFEDLYLGSTSSKLSDINYRFLCAICKILRITTNISWSSDYRILAGKTERLIDLCKQVGAREYISGPSAAEYIDADLFKKTGMTLTYISYDNYPKYHQMYPPFDHRVSILDLIFQTGPKAPKFMKSFK